ncbi:MAG: ABC transporter ATP-binding protein [Rhodocyclaceae bacterium]
MSREQGPRAAGMRAAAKTQFRRRLTSAQPTSSREAAAEAHGAPGALVVEDLEVAFGGLRAVAGASFEVAPGECCALIGPNGAGKSTVLNAVSGFVRADAGRILFAGRDLARLAAHRIAALGVARTFQMSALFEQASAAANVLAGLHLHRRTSVAADLLGLPSLKRAEREAREAALAALARLGLEGCAQRRVGELPHGLRKAVELARALASRPRLLLLDEPSAGLSAQEAARMASVLDRIRREDAVGVLMVEHDMRMVARLADRVIALDRGRVIAQGAPERVREDAAVLEAYLGE